MQKLTKVIYEHVCPFILQFPEFVASFFSRLSWPSVGNPPAAPTRNVVGNAPLYTGHQVEASIFLNYFSLVCTLHVYILAFGVAITYIQTLQSHFYNIWDT